MNQTADMEMIEVVEESPANISPGGAAAQNDVAGGFLALARQLVDQGKPSQALQAVFFPPNSIVVIEYSLQFIFSLISCGF